MKVLINGEERNITEEQAKTLGIDFKEDGESKTPSEKNIPPKKEDTNEEDPLKTKLDRLEKKQRDAELRERINKAKNKYGFTEEVIREKILPTAMERNMSFDEVVAIKKAEMSDEKSFNEFFGMTDGKDPKPEMGGPKSDKEFISDGMKKILEFGAKTKNIEY